MCWIFFFFFKQKTAYEMRISDWSSDVCSSDLPRERIDPAARSDRAPDPAVVRDAHPAQPRARARPDRARAVGGGLLPPAARRRPAALAGAALSADAVHRAFLCAALPADGLQASGAGDRKSTRLNSSH